MIETDWLPRPTSSREGLPSFAARAAAALEPLLELPDELLEPLEPLLEPPDEPLELLEPLLEPPDEPLEPLEPLLELPDEPLELLEPLLEPPELLELLVPAPEPPELSVELPPPQAARASAPTQHAAYSRATRNLSKVRSPVNMRVACFLTSNQGRHKTSRFCDRSAAAFCELIPDRAAQNATQLSMRVAAHGHDTESARVICRPGVPTVRASELRAAHGTGKCSQE
jgi:hypothetical protein